MQYQKQQQQKLSERKRFLTELLLPRDNNVSFVSSSSETCAVTSRCALSSFGTGVASSTVCESVIADRNVRPKELLNNYKFRWKCLENGRVEPFVELCHSCLELAIQSLDSLNDQIVQYIFAPKACDFDVDADDDCMQPKQREALKSSMALMRRLLMDAQAKFRKMVEDNKQLATRIDGDIQAAQEEVSILRAELADTNRRINELTPSSTSGSLSLMAGEAAKVTDKCQSCSRHTENQVQEELSKLKEEIEKLNQQNRSLQREVEELRSVKERMVAEDNELRPKVQKLETELQQAKDALTALKADRKRLKAEKFDLLNQMKQLYGTLEDKEKELRDFIRNYEQRMKESDSSLQQLSSMREETEMEKWNIIKHARDEAEKSVTLVSLLNQKDAQVKKLQEELSEAHKQLNQLGYYSDHDSQSGKVNGYRTPTSVTPVNTPNGREAPLGNAPSVYTSTPLASESGAPAITVDADNCSVYSSAMGTICTTESQSLLNIHPTGLSRSAEELSHMLSTLDLKKKGSTCRRNNAKGTWGSISKVFSRNKSRRSMDPNMMDSFDKRSSWSPHNSLCASPLTEETYCEKIKLLEEAQTVHIESWKAATVLAWLEVTMGMPQYGEMCAENIKSGKVLLELNDAELEAALGIINPMHRRKLRLAIEELRDPTHCKYPKISELSHVWVCSEWLPALGLSQYVDTFALHLVDARMLDYLSKKDLEKFLGVERKFHQVSIMHGIQLLRMVGFDRQILIERRSMCEHTEGDPLVWTNQRFIQWARSIDLGEYAENLKDSGVHGALVVLEPSFTADTMATALGIPQTKNTVRRHLMTELESIIHPARVLLEQEYFNNRQLTKKEKHAMGSLGRSFSHSYAGGLPGSKTDSRRSSLRRFIFRGSRFKRFRRRSIMGMAVSRSGRSGTRSSLDSTNTLISATKTNSDLNSTV